MVDDCQPLHYFINAESIMSDVFFFVVGTTTSSSFYSHLFASLLLLLGADDLSKNEGRGDGYKK